MNPVLAGLGLLAASVLSEEGIVVAPSTRLWILRFEDYVHPAKRGEARAAAEAAGGRWGAIDINGAVAFRSDSRAHIIRVLERAGYREGRYGQTQAWEK